MKETGPVFGSKIVSSAATEETKMLNLRERGSPATRSRLLAMTSAAALVVMTLTLASPVRADDATIQKWIDNEFQPSTLSKADQLKEMQWFAKAAEPFKGMEINVVSETITTHEYESRTLAKAFT
jgi:glycerol transport system substrate-binding protein